MNKADIEKQMFTAQMRFIEYLVFHGHCDLTPEEAEKVVYKFLKETLGSLSFSDVKELIKKNLDI